jgi:hypothetical protein
MHSSAVAVVLLLLFALVPSSAQQEAPTSRTNQKDGCDAFGDAFPPPPERSECADPEFLGECARADCLRQDTPGLESDKRMKNKKNKCMRVAPLPDTWSAVGIVANRDLDGEEEQEQEATEKKLLTAELRLCDGPGTSGIAFHGYRVASPPPFDFSVAETEKSGRRRSQVPFPLVLELGPTGEEVTLPPGSARATTDVVRTSASQLDFEWLVRSIEPAVEALNATVHRVALSDSRVLVTLHRSRPLAQLAGLLPPRMPPMDGAALRKTLDVFSIEFQRIVPQSGQVGAESSSWCVVPQDPAEGLMPPPRVVFVIAASGPVEWISCTVRNVLALRTKCGVDVRLILTYSFDDKSLEQVERMEEVSAMATRSEYVTVIPAPGERFSRAAGILRAISESRRTTLVHDDDVVVLADLHVSYPPSFIVDAIQHTSARRLAYAPVVRRLRSDQSTCNRSQARMEAFGWGILAVRGLDADLLLQTQADLASEESTFVWGGEDLALAERLYERGILFWRSSPRRLVHHFHRKNLGSCWYQTPAVPGSPQFFRSWSKSLLRLDHILRQQKHTDETSI